MTNITIKDSKDIEPAISLLDSLAGAKDFSITIGSSNFNKKTRLLLIEKLKEYILSVDWGTD